MSRDEVIAKLRQHAPELQAEGILHLALFGSTARNEATSSSDVDLLAEFANRSELTLFKLAGYEVRLSEMLDKPVDLTCPAWLKAPLRQTVLSEAVNVF